MKMSVLHVLVCAVLYTSVPRLYVHSANISNGKDAKQSTTHTDHTGTSHGADGALNRSYAALGSMTLLGSSSWLEVDLGVTSASPTSRSQQPLSGDGMYTCQMPTWREWTRMSASALTSRWCGVEQCPALLLLGKSSPSPATPRSPSALSVSQGDLLTP
ncbi:uncharacterized protein LOC124252798 [Haliotis rubra]|uniref:uncharacterized protein LOC124252798 n=1 Tax=Haliotis rubra TaxID=36100 RepID=UPI001EE5DE01|nr:uncharacterized protein LOC124252798 [Haliotis rubra]